MSIKIRNMASLAAFVAVMTGCFTGKTLTGQEIQHLIEGNTIHATSTYNSEQYKVFFHAPTHTSIRLQKGFTITTPYLIKGDEHCYDWNGRLNCAKIRKNFNGTYSRVGHNEKAGALWEKIEKGYRL